MPKLAGENGGVAGHTLERVSPAAFTRAWQPYNSHYELSTHLASTYLNASCAGFDLVVLRPYARGRMKLYRSREMPDHWIGEDKLGGLVYWPAQRGGWAQRTPYTGGKRPLEQVDPALARGTGWPGGGRGPAPRAESGAASKSITIRVTDAERSAWEGAAREHEQRLSDWIRDLCNAAAPPANRLRPRSKS